MDPRGAILRSHDETGDDLLCLGDVSRSWFGYFNVLLPYSTTLWLLAALVLLLISDSLLRSAVFGAGSVERLPQADSKRVLLVCQLVDKIARVTPEGEIGITRGGVEGGARAVPVVVVQKISRVWIPRACRRGQIVQRDVCRPPSTVRIGGNIDGGRLKGSSRLQI